MARDSIFNMITSESFVLKTQTELQLKDVAD